MYQFKPTLSLSVQEDFFVYHQNFQISIMIISVFILTPYVLCYCFSVNYHALHILHGHISFIHCPQL